MVDPVAEEGVVPPRFFEELDHLCGLLFSQKCQFERQLAVGSLLCLSVLGMIGARIGGAAILRPTLRVTFWGALAMATTTVIGALFGTAV